MMLAKCLCTSLAGHDTGELFFVLREDEDFCYLCDGRSRTVSKPKKKRKKHIQPIIHLSDELREMIGRLDAMQKDNGEADEQICLILKCYEQRSKQG